MEIIKADVLGFCKGVENAISIVIYTCEEYRGRSIKIYGELAHNKKVIGYIERLGAMTIDSPVWMPRGSKFSMLQTVMQLS